MVKEDTMTSILDSVKKALEIPEGVNAWDAKLILYINMSLSKLRQAGVGNLVKVTGSSEKWSDITKGLNPIDDISQLIESYVYLDTLIKFDPPPPGIQKNMEEALMDIMLRLRMDFDMPNDLRPLERTEDEA